MYATLRHDIFGYKSPLFADPRCEIPRSVDGNSLFGRRVTQFLLHRTIQERCSSKAAANALAIASLLLPALQASPIVITVWSDRAKRRISSSDPHRPSQWNPSRRLS